VSRCKKARITRTATDGKNGYVLPVLYTLFPEYGVSYVSYLFPEVRFVFKIRYSLFYRRWVASMYRHIRPIEYKHAWALCVMMYCSGDFKDHCYDDVIDAKDDDGSPQPMWQSVHADTALCGEVT